MQPDLNQFQRLARAHGLVPAFVERPADLDTPVSLYLKAASDPAYATLLESVEGGERLARYSFISVSHHLRFQYAGGEAVLFEGGRTVRSASDDPLGELKAIFARLRPAALPGLPRFCGGAVGYVGYDLVRKLERIPPRLAEPATVPEAVFLFTDECIVFDHWKHKMMLIKWNRIRDRRPAALARQYAAARRSLERMAERIRAGRVPAAERAAGAREPVEARIRSNFTPGRFQGLVRRAKEYIRAGDVIQVVLSQRFELQSDLSPVAVYRALRMVNPSPYLYLLNLGGFSIVGSSPEILVRKEGGRALTRPIAGTRKRGSDEARDRALEEELRADPKERAEHLMLVDLGRNDLGRCCRPGSVQVSDFMSVERYSHVMHLVSSVEGTLSPGEDSFSLFKASFPAGTVAGAPKIRAMQIIEELENVRRGIYAGSIGYFSYNGDMDMAITIRTLLIQRGKIYMQAGAGIVADSVPALEEKETRNKAAALFRAVEMAERGLEP